MNDLPDYYAEEEAAKERWEQANRPLNVLICTSVDALLWAVGLLTEKAANGK